MRKIPTVLVRNPDDRKHVLPEVTPGCEWVLAGEGTPTRKYDGTCCKLDEDGRWWARREIKPGKQPPSNFQPEDHDETTGKTQGWVPMEDSAFKKWHDEALEGYVSVGEPGTYELCGPKINGNPEGIERHQLVSHDHAQALTDLKPRSIASILSLARDCGSAGWEGVVWHHPDGRMAKLKARDVRS